MKYCFTSLFVIWPIRKSHSQHSAKTVVNYCSYTKRSPDRKGRNRCRKKCVCYSVTYIIYIRLKSNWRIYVCRRVWLSFYCCVCFFVNLDNRIYELLGFTFSFLSLLYNTFEELAPQLWRNEWKNNYKFVQFIIISICLNFITYIIHNTRTQLLVETHVCSLFYLYEHKYVELSSAHRKKNQIIGKKRKSFVYSLHTKHIVYNEHIRHIKAKRWTRTHSSTHIHSTHTIGTKSHIIYIISFIVSSSLTVIVLAQIHKHTYTSIYARTLWLVTWKMRWYCFDEMRLQIGSFSFAWKR